ncbi:ABC transporter ATP-binding protein [Chryseomicrobium sp. FSL W7-1435]|uniref:ABC transporter ATP-binding protein n=1 Tax=Chryseomicrobium sp. FSL W7-1435 TaxID=2921704 RepID=UPI003159C188
MAVVTANHLTKIYDGKVAHSAINQLSFEVEQGEFLAIMGPSGSGKTTLLNILSTIDQPTSGALVIDGQDPQELTAKQAALFRRERLGFVFQDFNLLPALTVEENIVLPLTLANQPLSEMEKRLNVLLKDLHLENVHTHFPNELSGGQAQRTAIARALIHQPTLLLADEPTGNLDSKASKDVLELLTKVNQQRNTTIIMVTHDPIAASYCDRVLFIKDGEYFNEIYKEDLRQTFFQRILNLLSLLGGNVNDLSTVRLS